MEKKFENNLKNAPDVWGDLSSLIGRGHSTHTKKVIYDSDYETIENNTGDLRRKRH